MRLRLVSSEARAEPTRPRTRSRSSSALTSPGSHVVDVHLDRADRQPGQPLHLVGDAVADARRDLGEVEAVLDDDVEIDGDPAVVAADLDPARRPRARASRPRSEPFIPTTP